MADVTDGGSRGRVLITGGAGRIGTVLRHGLPACGWAVRSLDLRPIEDPQPGEQVVDAGDLDAACAGVDAVVHLAAIPTEAPYERILSANVETTCAIFEAARRAGVPRMVFASSIHASGFSERVDLLPTDAPPRPDTHYGVSKVFGEAVGRMYADRYGLRVACLRIGAFQPEPRGPHALAHWLSHDDAVRLVDACLGAPDLTYAIVYGRSDNTRGWTDLSAGRALGFEPKDDAENWAEQILAEHGEAIDHRLGADMTGPDFDADPVAARWAGRWAGR